jgi:hypothetical protein
MIKWFGSHALTFPSPLPDSEDGYSLQQLAVITLFIIAVDIAFLLQSALVEDIPERPKRPQPAILG